MSLSMISGIEKLGLIGSIAGGYDVACSQFNTYSFISTTAEEMISSYDNSMLLPLTSIEEEQCVSDDDEDSLFSIDFNFNHNNNDYKEEEEEDQREVAYYHVAVGQKSESSMDALLWNLSQAVNHHDDQSSPTSTSTTTLVIVHVFPPIRFIPSPLGMLPISKVSPKMVDKHMAQERDRRQKLLDKYVHPCSTAKVKVDIMLIEGDSVAKAILDLVPTHNISKLVVGTTNSSMRKLRSKKGSGIASQILRNAPESCDIKIICKGREVIGDMTTGSSSSRSSNANSLSTQEEDHHQELPISADYNKKDSCPA